VQNCAQLYRIFCVTSGTNLVQLLDFLSATFWWDYITDTAI